MIYLEFLGINLHEVYHLSQLGTLLTRVAQEKCLMGKQINHSALIN